MTVDPEQRFQTEQKQRETHKKSQFEATQRQAKSALITKILNEVCSSDNFSNIQNRLEQV